MVHGGFATYGKVAGIMMLDSTIPRIPGDPGNAQTFSYPVIHGVVKGLPFSDLVEGSMEHAEAAVACARELEARGVSFIAADCGLFSLFQEKIGSSLRVPFLGSSLSLVPLLGGFAPPGTAVGILTGHIDLLKDFHLRAAGADKVRTVISGMELSQEFRRVVMERGDELDPDAMRLDTRRAAARLAAKAKAQGVRLSAVVIECTNLVSFRSDIQDETGSPVYDLVSLIDLYASGYARTEFAERYRSFASDSVSRSGGC